MVGSRRAASVGMVHAQSSLVYLAGRGQRHGLDQHHLIGQPPVRDLAAQGAEQSIAINGAALARSTTSTVANSRLPCFAIVGGAVPPMAAGLIADTAGLHAAYLVPMVDYLCITLFAVGAGRAGR
jgi:hypothetical protein